VFNMTEEEWDRVMAVHLKGHFNCTKFACLYWRERFKREQKGGVLINTSSIAGWGNMGQANYSAAKEGIIGLTRTVALDMARYGVRVYGLRPGAGTRMTLTPELKAAWEKRRAAGLPSVGGAAEEVPALPDLPDPEWVAPMIVWLCTDAGAKIPTGSIFHCAGGNIELEAKPSIVKGIYKEGKWTLDELDRIAPRVFG